MLPEIDKYQSEPVLTYHPQPHVWSRQRQWTYRTPFHLTLTLTVIQALDSLGHSKLLPWSAKHLQPIIGPVNKLQPHVWSRQRCLQYSTSCHLMLPEMDECQREPVQSYHHQPHMWSRQCDWTHMNKCHITLTLTPALDSFDQYNCCYDLRYFFNKLLGLYTKCSNINLSHLSGADSFV